MNRQIQLAVAVLVLLVATANHPTHAAVQWQVDLRNPQTGTFVLRAPAASLDADLGPIVVVSNTSDDGASAATRVLTIDPTFYPPGPRSDRPGEARALIHQNLAVLRTDRAFPRPATGKIELEFLLPEGWAAITPWEKAEKGFLVSADSLTRADYIAFGPFAVASRTLGESEIRVGVHKGVDSPGPDDVVRAYEATATAFGGPPPRSEQTFAVSILPTAEMRGGASGTYTVVLGGARHSTLVHELAHWWIHRGVVHEEARWFLEGLTQYYGIALAERAALMSTDEALQHFGDLYGEAQYIEQQDGPRTLANASLHYGDPTDRYAGRLVYAKGALLGWQLQRVLTDRGRSLDEVMVMILQSRRPPLDTEAIQAAFHEVYAGTVDNLLNSWLNDATPLEVLPLPPATGESGEAKFLPGRD